MHVSSRSGRLAIEPGHEFAEELEPLSALVSRTEPLAVEDGLAILEDLFTQVAAIHRYEKAHGALGPETVLVPTSRLSAARAATDAVPAPLLALGLPDREGTTVIPGFSSPEHRPGEVRREEDVWAAGAIAFYLFARRPPGHAASRDPLALAAPAVPFRLGQIVDRLLEADPDRRPTADDTAAALRALRLSAAPPREEESAPPVRPAPRPSRGERFPRWFGHLFRRRAARQEEEPATPEASPASRGRHRIGGTRSSTFLCLDDFGPLPRTPAPEVDAALLRLAVEETVAEAGRGDEPPVFPSIALEVIELARQEHADANDLVRAINRDPSLTARVLRMANSAYANRGLEVTSARDAVTRLGFREVANVAAAAATRTLFVAGNSGSDPAIVLGARQVWVHSLASALSASWLAMECRADSQRAFLGGMLHDVGKTMALRALARLVERGEFPTVDPGTIVGPVLEACHVEMGLMMARAWGLPEAVVRACGEHHRTNRGPHEDPVLHVVRTVSGMATLHLEPSWSPDRLWEAQESALLLRLDRFRIRSAAAQVRLLVGRAEALGRAAE